MITHLTDAQISNIMNADKRMQRLQSLRRAVRAKFPIQHSDVDCVFAQMLSGTHGQRGDAILARVESMESARIRQIYDALQA